MLQFSSKLDPNISRKVTIILLGDPQTGKSSFRNTLIESYIKDSSYLLSHDEFSNGINVLNLSEVDQSKFYSSLKSVVRYHEMEIEMQTPSGNVKVDVELRDALGSATFDNTKHLLFEKGRSNNDDISIRNVGTYRLNSQNGTFNDKKVSYNQEMAVVLLCFSFDQLSSYQNIEKKWIVKAQKSLAQHQWGNNYKIILVGLKDDHRIQSLTTGKSLPDRITHQDGLDLASKLNVHAYFETSVIRPVSIQNVFQTSLKMSLFPFETKIKKGSRKNIFLKLLDNPKGESEISIEFADSTVASYKITVHREINLTLSVDRNAELNSFLFYNAPDSWRHEFSIHGEISIVQSDPQQMKAYQLHVSDKTRKNTFENNNLESIDKDDRLIIQKDLHSASTPNLDISKPKVYPPPLRKRSTTLTSPSPKNDDIIESLTKTISDQVEELSRLKIENEKMKQENEIMKINNEKLKKELNDSNNHQLNMNTLVNELETLREENENLKERINELTELQSKVFQDKGRLEEQLKAQRKKIWKVNPKMIEFQDFLNRGSFGSVYKGKLNVAVKKITLGRNRKKMVLNEVGLMWEISHKNVLKCFGLAFETNKDGVATHAHILMELCQCNILEYFERFPDMPLSEKLTMLLGIAKGLYRTHSHGIVHRDLKPENCLVDFSGEVKVSDFGSSKHQESISSTLCGTPSYLSPELYDNSVTESIDPLAATMYSRNESSVGYGTKVDIYAFGIMMWQLLTGKTPYEDIMENSPGGYLQVLRIIHRSDPVKRPPLSILKCPRGISESVLNDIKTLIKQCWSVNPADRPENFKVVGLELKRIRKQVRKEEKEMHYQVEEPSLNSPSQHGRVLKLITVLYDGKYIELRDIQDELLTDKIILAHFLLVEMGLLGVESGFQSIYDALDMYNLKFGNVDFDSFDLNEGLLHETLMVKIEKLH